MAEHIIYWHPILIMQLKQLFNICLEFGIVPTGFSRGIIIPLIKDSSSDESHLDNYRGIMLSPVISKVFEHILCNKYKNWLYSSHLQFGFKNNSSCRNASQVLRTVVNHYAMNGVTGTLCALDISKAFD